MHNLENSNHCLRIEIHTLMDICHHIFLVFHVVRINQLVFESMVFDGKAADGGSCHFISTNNILPPRQDRSLVAFRKCSINTLSPFSGEFSSSHAYNSKLHSLFTYNHKSCKSETNCLVIDELLVFFIPYT